MSKVYLTCKLSTLLTNCPWVSADCSVLHPWGVTTCIHVCLFFIEHLACVASVSVGLGSKGSQRNGIFGVLPARKFPLSNPPPLFRFLALAPFFAREKHRNSRSSVFLCSQTPRKRLLRRLSNTGIATYYFPLQTFFLVTELKEFLIGYWFQTVCFPILGI